MIQGPNRGSNYGRGSRSYRTAQDTTRTIRATSAWGAFVGVVLIVVQASQFITLALASSGMAFGVLVILSAVGSLTAIVLLFRSEFLEGRRVSVLMVPVAILVISFLVPGLPPVIA